MGNIIFSELALVITAIMFFNRWEYFMSLLSSFEGAAPFLYHTAIITACVPLIFIKFAEGEVNNRGNLNLSFIRIYKTLVSKEGI